MSARESIRKNASLNFLGNVLPIIVAIAALPYTINNLGVELFGILTISWLIIGNSVIFDLGMGRAITVFSTKCIKENDFVQVSRVLACGIQVQLLIGGIASLAFIVFSPFLVESVFTIPSNLVDESIEAFTYASIGIPISLASSSYRGLLEAGHRFDFVSAFKSIFSSLTYLTPVIGIWFNMDIGEITILLVVFQSIQLLALHLSTFSLFKEIDWSLILNFNKDVFKEMFSFGGWISFSNVISVVQENIERLLIAGLLPISMVTYYSVPKDMLDKVYLIPSSLTRAIFPTIVLKADSAKKDLIQLFNQALKFIGVIVSFILFGGILLAKPLLSIWVSEEFSDKATFVFQVLSFGVLASSLNMLSVSLFQGVKRPVITVVQQLIRLPIILFMAWYLISTYGLIGGAFSWILARALALAMNFWAIFKKLEWELKDFLDTKTFLMIVSLPVSAFLYINVLDINNIDSLVTVLLYSFFGIIVFGIWNWYLILRDQDRFEIIKMCLKWISFFKKKLYTSL
jgi:O-antigen/teichoic acid export membrane protein